MKISAVIITLNEESNIERCLRSLEFADEIIVLDSFSSDRTVEIARRFTDKISQRKYTGESDQRNAALELASNDWALMLDADEVVTPELAVEMQKAVESDKFDAYQMPRLAYFLGKPIRHCGWYPDRIVRLMRRSKIRYPDRIVHAAPEVEGSIGMLSNDLLHFTHKSLEDAIRKMVDYSNRVARQKYSEGRRPKASDLLIRPGLTFLKKYIVQQGFRDGMRGLVICALTQCGVFLRYAALWEISIRKEQCEHE